MLTLKSERKEDSDDSSDSDDSETSSKMWERKYKTLNLTFPNFLRTFCCFATIMTSLLINYA